MLMLDPKVRNWVMLPITFAMFLIGILRHLMSKLLRGTSTAKLKQIQQKQILQRSQYLRAHASFITHQAFHQRKHYFCDKSTGVLCKEADPSQSAQAQMMSDPNMLSDMMKKNLTMIVPQIATGAWVNFFFSGFVVAKVPFPLTPRFRVMLQRGVDLSSLDVTYISSLSWYFLNLFGMQGVLTLVMGEKTFDDTQLIQQQMGAGAGAGPMGGMDNAAALKGEKDQVDMMAHEWKVGQFIEHATKSLTI
mmetsp:Transcript_3869/g.9863  ORF Transcript_3869/g.9863 Transcript_3869/m.9863 type:complete len:248 (-) Transcript_3869:55-798(-)